MHTFTTRPMTIADRPDDDARHELIDGGLFVSPDPTIRHLVLAMRLALYLSGLIGPWQPLAGGNIIADESTLVIPDVMLITRVSADRGELGVAPTDVLLAVEIESASTGRCDRTLKRSLYREWDVPLWLVDPVARTISTDGTAPIAPPHPDSLFGQPRTIFADRSPRA